MANEQRRRRFVHGMLVPVALCALATGLCRAASLEGKPGPGAIFLVAVCLSAYAGGLAAGLLAAALSYLAASWFFVEPTHSLALNADRGIFAGALLLASIPIVALLERERRLRRELRAGSLQLERELEDSAAAAGRERFLTAAGQALNSSLDLELILERLGELAVPELADWSCVELMPDGAGQRLESPPRSEYGALEAGNLATVKALIDARQVAANGDPELHARLGGEALSALVLPLLARGRVVGCATFVRNGTRGPYEEAELALASELVRRAVVALDNALLHRTAELARARAETAAARVQRLQTVIDATFVSASSDEFLDQLLERLREAIGADTATILTATDGEVLVVRRSTGFAVPIEARIPFGTGFAGRIAATRTHAVSSDLGPADLAVPGFAREVLSAAGAPLIADGALVGVLQVGSRTRRVFGEEDVMLLRLVAARAAISLERAQLYERGQSVAEGLQRSLLPGRFPTIEGFEAAARYVPGTVGLEVGGDWYDVFELADGSIAISMGDVMGRGIVAAATMSQLRNVLRAYALEGLAPGETLVRLNRLATEGEIFATVVYAVISPSRASLRIANAGHPPPLLRSGRGAVRRVVEGSAPPIGALLETAFVDAEVSLESDSSLVFYTDGLVERRGESIDVCIDRLARIVSESAEPVHQLIDTIVERLETDDHPDDRALLVVRLDRAPAERITLRFAPDSSSLAAARDRLRSWLRDRGAHEDEIFDIVFAVNEACSNAIEHPVDVKDDEIGLDAELTGDRVAIVVNDGGRWKAETGSRYRGRGLALMQELMGSVEITQSSDGTSVRLERVISGAPSWSSEALPA